MSAQLLPEYRPYGTIPNGATPGTVNQLIAALPVEDYKRISAHLSRRSPKPRQLLQKREEPMREVYFPSGNLCSLVMTLEDGNAAEIAVVGSEGFVGVEAVLGLPVSMCDATVQIAGNGVLHAMSVEAFRDEVDQQGPFSSLVKEYAQRLVGSVMQSVVCNGLHAARSRCCRWLLHAQDRLGRDELSITHDLLSTMLGVRRPTVTLIISELVGLGIISTTRGTVRITNRKALEGRSCECYETVTRLFITVSPVYAPQHGYGGEKRQEDVSLTT